MFNPGQDRKNAWKSTRRSLFLQHLRGTRSPRCKHYTFSRKQAPAPAPKLYRTVSEPSALRVEDHHPAAGVIFYVTRDSQYGESERWGRMHDFRQSTRKAAAAQARIVAKPPSRQLPFVRRGVVEMAYVESTFAQSSDQVSTKSFATTSRLNKGKTAA